MCTVVALLKKPKIKLEFVDSLKCALSNNIEHDFILVERHRKILL